MERKPMGLAARFRQALADAEQGRRTAAEREAAALEEAQRARDTLFADLEGFAKDTGFVAARRDPDGVMLRYRHRWLQFTAVGESGAVKVTFEPMGEEDHRLYREPALQDRWVWVARRRTIEDRVPLFDKGLEELLVRALGLPRPGDAAPVSRPEPVVAEEPKVKKKL